MKIGKALQQHARLNRRRQNLVQAYSKKYRTTVCRPRKVGQQSAKREEVYRIPVNDGQVVTAFVGELGSL